MIEIQTIKTIRCNACESVIEEALPAKIREDFHLCRVCLKAAYLEYKRTVDHQVPSRRGGFRELGVYDR